MSFSEPLSVNLFVPVHAGLYCVGQFMQVYAVWASSCRSILCGPVHAGLYCVGQFMQVYAVQYFNKCVPGNRLFALALDQSL